MSPKPTRKRCAGCRQEKPLDSTNFRRDSAQPSGFKPRCKGCEPKRGQPVSTVNKHVGSKFDDFLDEIASERGIKRDKRPLKPLEDDDDLLTFIKGFTGKPDRGPWPDAGETESRLEEEEKLSAVEEHRLKRKCKDLEAQNRQLIQDLSEALNVGDIVREAQELEDVPGIEPRERDSGLREGTALAMASDWHIDEIIEPGQVNGRNRYNPDISARRMERFFESVLWAINSQRNTFSIRDLVLWLGGDLITNYLHEDNVLTNAMSPPEALAYAQRAISDGIRFLLTDPELERIVIPCNDGNHGRMSKRMGSSSRIMMSLEIMLYRMLQREFKDEPRVKFIIAEGEHLYYRVYGRTIRFAHGDSIKYSNGIGGITIPIMKALAAWDSLHHADLTCIGHFHQRLVLPNLQVNGSLIGYGPFSMTIRARFEPPSQNFSILEPKRFRSIDVPLWVSERADDDDSY